jgi:hypothetical protein
LHEPAFVSMIGRTHVFKQSHWKSNEMRHSVQGLQTTTNGSFQFNHPYYGMKSPINPLSQSMAHSMKGTNDHFDNPYMISSPMNEILV